MYPKPGTHDHMRAALVGLAVAIQVALAPLASAETTSVIDLPTRSGVTQRLVLVEPDGKPRAAAVLIAGGHGALKIFPNGSFGWGDQGFLVRNRGLLAQQGIAVAVIDAPSDKRSGLAGSRDTDEHMVDIAATIKWLRERTGVAVWLIGHSRGTESAAAAALRLGPSPAGPDGLVLASPISSESAFAKGHAVTHFTLEQLQLPVLVLAHEADGCSVTAPKDLPLVVDRLTGASRKKVIELSGGRPAGDLCAHQGTHGFGGLDAAAVQVISDFVLQ